MVQAVATIAAAVRVRVEEIAAEAALVADGDRPILGIDLSLRHST